MRRSRFYRNLIQAESCTEHLCPCARVCVCVCVCLSWLCMCVFPQRVSAAHEEAWHLDSCWTVGNTAARVFSLPFSYGTGVWRRRCYVDSCPLKSVGTQLTPRHPAVFHNVNLQGWAAQIPSFARLWPVYDCNGIPHVLMFFKFFKFFKFFVSCEAHHSGQTFPEDEDH